MERLKSMATTAATYFEAKELVFIVGLVLLFAGIWTVHEGLALAVVGGILVWLSVARKTNKVE